MPEHARYSSIISTYAGLFLITAATYMVMYGPQPMFNTISRDLGVDRGSIGLVISVFMVFLSVSPLCVGLLLGKIGIRRALFASSAAMILCGAALYFVPSFGALMTVRTVQGMLTPILLTGVMAAIAGLFRHLDINRAMAGFVAASTLGSLAGRLLGGCSAEWIGWRESLTLMCGLFVICLFAIRRMPAANNASSVRIHRLSEYRQVLRQKGVAPLICVEACGLFTFAAIGNLIPLRMAELGHGTSEGLIGLMYLGYAVGPVAASCLGPLTRLFGSTARLLIFGASLFAVSLLSFLAPCPTVIFAGLWFVALGEFIIHALCPGVINHLATRTGHCDRGMVNGLFLSCYYFGGLVGSWLPGLLYQHFGWTACFASMEAVQLCSLTVVLILTRRMPDIR